MSDYVVFVFSKHTTSPNYLRLYKTLPEVPHGCRNFLLICRPAKQPPLGLPRATIDYVVLANIPKTTSQDPGTPCPTPRLSGTRAAELCTGP